MLFTSEIRDWATWSNVFNSTAAFAPLVSCILKKGGLPDVPPVNTTPGTNAVFKCGVTVVKIFAPAESGMDCVSDFAAELSGLEHAASRGVTAPRILGSGVIDDKYAFRYFVMEYVDGCDFGDVRDSLNDAQKYAAGRRFRDITDRLDVPCRRFNDVDFLKRALECRCFDSFPDSFRRERIDRLGQYSGGGVFVHGDLNPDNIIVKEDDSLSLIDFADAIIAPRAYEDVVLMCETFKLEKPYLDGYFDGITADAAADLCVYGLLIHDFGANIIRDNFGEPESFASVGALREKIRETASKKAAAGD